jgi:iron complex outermembrane receptor protein
LLAGAWLIAGASVASAQGDSTPRFEQQIVVTPNRSQSTLDRVPAFVTVLDRDDIVASTAHDVPELLQQAGVHVTDVTGNGRSYSVDLRGFGATAGLNTLVLVDGRAVNEPDLSGADWFQIPLNRIARIEVIRGGGGAVAFGDGAAGGVVNIVTMGGEAQGASLSVRGGGYEALTTEAVASGRRDRLSYAVSGRYDRAEGYRSNAQTDGGDVGGHLGVQAGDRFDVSLSGGYHTDDTGLPGALRASESAAGAGRRDTTHPDDFANVDDGYVMVTPRWSLADRASLSIDVSVRHRDSTFFSSFVGGEFTGETGTRTYAASPRLVITAPFAGLSHHLVGGFDVSRSRERIGNTSTFTGFSLFTLTRTDRGGYVQDEAQIGRASVTAGYRYDAARFDFDPSDPSRARYHSQAGSVGATVAAVPGTTVFGRVSRSFRYPVLDELFDFFGNTIAGNIVPQRSTDVEGGLRLERGPLQASLSVFHSRTGDEIFFNPVGGAFASGANENLDGTAARTGFEAELAARAGRVDLGGTLTVLRARIDGGLYDGARVPGVPRTRASFIAGVPLGRGVSLRLDGQYVGARLFEGDLSGELGDQDDYFVADARVAFDRGRMRLFIDVKNLFNAEYSAYGVLAGFPTERAFYPSPGIHALAGVEVRF